MDGVITNDQTSPTQGDRPSRSRDFQRDRLVNLPLFAITAPATELSL